MQNHKSYLLIHFKFTCEYTDYMKPATDSNEQIFSEGNIF
jgi:hypothetical protein